MLRLLRPQIAFLTHVEATNSLAWKGSQKELEFEQLAFFDSQVRHFFADTSSSGASSPWLGTRLTPAEDPQGLGEGKAVGGT